MKYIKREINNREDNGEWNEKREKNTNTKEIINWTQIGNIEQYFIMKNEFYKIDKN